MKLLVIILGLLLVSFIFVAYDLNTGNEIIERNFKKLTNQYCEFKYLPNGWTQIENCELYKVKQRGRING